MPMRVLEAPLWHFVGTLERDELEAWRKKHHPDLTAEEAFAVNITEVQTEVKRRPGGNVWVTVSILARRTFECEENAFRLQRAGNRMYRILEPDEISTSG